MGALTLKSFPFELRGWDIEKSESIDPTDGFGSNTRVYISKDQIVQIEPDFDIYNQNMWLTDKGRQFFDGIFGNWGINSIEENSTKTKVSSNVLKSIAQTLYLFEHCRVRQSNQKFFTVIFGNISIEILSLLNLISEKNSFLKLRKAENLYINNDLEADLQLNLTTNKTKLSNSTFCLILSTNPRYEGYYLNLKLRQRFLKGNFKCLIIGSLIDLTFPVSFLGSNVNIFKDIAEGNHILCQELKSAKNPIIISNYELLRRHDGNNILKMLKHFNSLNNSWNGFNMLSPSLNEVGIHSLKNFVSFNEKDLFNFSFLYFLNTNLSNNSSFKKVLELKLLNIDNTSNLSKNHLFIDQNSKLNNNIETFNKLKNFSNKEKFFNYFNLPSSMFYENEETFINTEGFIKRTTKLIFRKKTKNSWQIIRKVFKNIQNKLIFLNDKDNHNLIFNSTKILNFKNYINFHYQATQTITNLSFYLSIKNQSFNLLNNNLKFKQSRKKIQYTKLKYWLDDFFNGGTDEYSQYSLILSNCSKIVRSKNTNFF